jgi:argininosuccinate lyase
MIKRKYITVGKMTHIPAEYKNRGHGWPFFRPEIGRLKEEPSEDFIRAKHGFVPKERTFAGPGYNPFYAYHMFDKTHVVMLTETGIIPNEDGVKILKAFRKMEAEGVVEARTRVGGEDHSGEVYLLIELGWEIGGRIHVGRSTGDLGYVSRRITARDYLFDIMDASLRVRKAMVDLAEKHVGSVMPGYSVTYQHAQPVTFGYYTMAFVNQLERNFDKLEFIYNMQNISPAGSAIGMGTDFPGFDRYRQMELLGFDDLFENCYDAGHNKDYADVFGVLLCINESLSELANDLAIYSTCEFMYVRPADRYSGSSSIMPQKHNASGFIYLAGMGNRTKGHLINNALNRALIDTCNALDMWPGILSTLTVYTDRMEKRAGEFWAQAVDIAAQIVREKGLPWRTAHQITGTLVRICVDEDKTPQDVTPALIDRCARMVPEWEKPVGLSIEAIKRAINPRAMAERRDHIGGVAPTRVREQIAKSRALLNNDSGRVEAKRKKIAEAAEKLEKAIDALIGS